MLKAVVEKIGEVPRALMVWTAIVAPVVVVILWGETDRPTPAARMLAAAQSGNVSEIETSLKRGAKVDVLDEIGCTPLMIAARAGNLDAVQRLLDRGAEIDARTPVCGTALIQASLFGRTEVVQLLLRRHANIRIANMFGRTALDYAMMSGSASTELVQCLLRAQGIKASAEQVECARRASDIPARWGAADPSQTNPPAADRRA
jgi:ankyrin repeat protein